VSLFLRIARLRRLKNLKKESFANSKGLKSIYIPESVSSFGADIFKSSNSLKTVYVKKDSKADEWAADFVGVFKVEYK
jgi:hypothetical protein